MSTPERRRTRETILARRALFVASALQGLGLVTREARGESEEQGPAAEASTSASASAPPLPPPEWHEPRVCLSPLPPPDRPNHDEEDMAIGIAPLVLAPMAGAQAGGNDAAFGLSFTLGARYGMTKRSDLTLLAVAIPSSFGANPFTPIGGIVRWTTSAVTPLGWDQEYRLFSSFEVGGGGWLSRSRRGAAPDEWVPGSGAWFTVGVTPIGYRHAFGRESYGEGGYYATNKHMLEIGLQTSLWWSTQRSSDAVRIGVSYLSIGLGVTYYMQLKKPTTTLRNSMARGTTTDEDPTR